MEAKLVGSTNRIKRLSSAKRYIQNHARICYSEKNWDELLEESFSPKFVGSLADNGHHSPFDKFDVDFELREVPKALAMVLNNQGVYATEEKSARYTKMKVSSHQRELYDKWDSWFNSEINSRFPESDFPGLYKKSGGKTAAEKLAQENARYMTSVFTPTHMTHKVSLRQLNILYHWFNDFVNVTDNSDVFENRLAWAMDEFNSLPEIEKWIIPEAQIRMKGGRPFRFFSEREVKERFNEDSFAVNYNTSFASLAQHQRHRLSTYDVFSGTELGAPNGFYVLRLVEASGKTDEWIKDLEDVAEYDFPQAQLLGVSERGLAENLPAKSIERLCGLAQLETARNVGEVMSKYAKAVPSMEKYNQPACRVEGGCHKGGCVFGADNYLTRLI